MVESLIDIVEVFINGEPIDLISKGVKYTKQVNDLADLSTVNTSFTYSLRADKTPNNTRIFQNLGMIGDTSEFPYVKNVTQLIDNGAMLISMGITTVKETTDEYKLHIQEGIIEVFKQIENKTIGKDLDLTELSHEKTVQTIFDSWFAIGSFGQGSPPYAYLLADYGGRITADDGSIDAEYLMPSANVGYLWDKIFNRIGYTYSGVPDDIKHHWITYPQEGDDQDDVMVFHGLSKPYKSSGGGTINSGPWPTTDYQFWLNTGVTPVGLTIINDWIIQVDETTNYKLEFYPTTPASSPLSNFPFGAMKWYSSPVGSHFDWCPFWIVIYIGGTEAIRFRSDIPPLLPFNFGTIGSGVNIKIEIEPLTTQDAMAYMETSFPDVYPVELITYGIGLQIFSAATDFFDFQEAFASYSIKDFFKEIMFRNALTPFVDNHEKHIEFIPLTERLEISTTNAVDLSDKFIKRTSESYVYENYAKKNLLKLKYENEEDDFNDGAIFVKNEHLEDEKVLLQSKFFSPERLPSSIVLKEGVSTVKLPVLKIWEKEIKEEENDQGDTVQVIEYKTLSNKFHYIGQQVFFQETSVNGQNIFFSIGAYMADVSWDFIVSNKYGSINKIFTDTRIHEIELALSANEFATLDLRKLYYFEQEMQYYILNKIRWESGRPAKGEFLRVKNI